MSKKTIFIVMGVSGCGKSTIGRLLAKEMNLIFYDGDDYHDASNVKKMSQGIPLTDSDRKKWLERLHQLAVESKELGAVIACSALKVNYRKILSHRLDQYMQFVYLDGSKQEISDRLYRRKDHFMPAGLLDSQFDSLEPPKEAITVSISNTPEAMVLKIIEQLKNRI